MIEVKAVGNPVHMNGTSVSNFPEAIRLALSQLGYMGLAGVFKVSDTHVKGRILERYPEHQAHLEEYFGMNLHHYTEATSPLVATTTLISDISRRRYSPEHTHTWGNVEASEPSSIHYEGVTETCSAEYHGYFVVATAHKAIPDSDAILQGMGHIDELAGRELTVAEYVVAALYSLGVTRVFGYEGTSVIPIIDSIVDSNMQWVLVRNESNAALAAAAQAKLTGGLGVCVATGGPGALNMITGVDDAHFDRVSVLAITGMQPESMQSRTDFQDTDHARVFSALGIMSVVCVHPRQIFHLLRDCLADALTSGHAVHLAIPVDVQKARVRVPKLNFMYKRPSTASVFPTEAHLDFFIKALSGYSKVVIAAGARALSASAQVQALAEVLQAPILTSLDAKGIVSEDHPLVLGVFGIFGFPGLEHARKAVMEAECVISIGLEDPSLMICDVESGLQCRRLFEIAPEYALLNNRFAKEAVLVGMVHLVVASLTQKLSSNLLERKEPAILKEEAPPLPLSTENTNFCHPARFFGELNKYLDASSVVVLDVGDVTVWTAMCLCLTKHQRLLTTMRMGTMGYCIPAMIATKLTRPYANVVGIVGDGGIQMSIGELSTAMQHNLSLLLIVLQNGVLGRIEANRLESIKLANPDYTLLAKAYGGDGAVISRAEDIKEVLHTDIFSQKFLIKSVVKVLGKAFSNKGGIFIVTVNIDPELCAPVAKWGVDRPATHSKFHHSVDPTE